MDIGGREQEEQRQARAAAQQRVDPVTAQQRARVVGWGMADRCIRVGPAPRQDRGTIDDEVTRADEPSVQRQAHEDHQQSFTDWRSCPGRTFPLLGGAGYTWLALRIH
jgi:hypothetical protein